MNERKEVLRTLYPEALDEVLAVEAERDANTATLLVIDDSNYKDNLQKTVQGDNYGDTQKLPISTHRVYAAGEGLAFVKMYYNQHDILQEDAARMGETYTVPPLFIAMDGTLPFRDGLGWEPNQFMGLLTTKAIIEYCEGIEGGETFPIPYFIGYSSDRDPNKSIDLLLQSKGAGDRYLGDFFHGGKEQILQSLQRLSS